MTADDRPSIAELQRYVAPARGSHPRRLTDDELTVQHAGYHDFNAIESMVVEMREHRRNAVAVAVLPVLLDISAAALAYSRPVTTEQGARDKETARRALESALAKVRQ